MLKFVNGEWVFTVPGMCFDENDSGDAGGGTGDGGTGDGGGDDGGTGDGGGDGGGSGDTGGGRGGDGGGSGDTSDTGDAAAFLSTLNEDLRAEPSLQTIKDVNGLAKSFVNAQKMIGLDKIAKPTENSTDAEWTQFYDSLGRPATSGDYVPPVIEGWEWQPERVAALQEVAHSVGITDKQWTALATAHAESEKAGAASETMKTNDFIKSTEIELRKEWGSTYDVRMADAENGIDALGGDEFAKLLKDSGLNNHGVVIKAVAKVGRMFAEDGFGEGNPLPGLMTPEAATVQLETLMRDEKFQAQYLNANVAGHQEAVARITKLNELIHGVDPANTVALSA